MLYRPWKSLQIWSPHILGCKCCTACVDFLPMYCFHLHTSWVVVCLDNPLSLHILEYEVHCCSVCACSSISISSTTCSFRFPYILGSCALYHLLFLSYRWSLFTSQITVLVCACSSISISLVLLVFHCVALSVMYVMLAMSALYQLLFSTRFIFNVPVISYSGQDSTCQLFSYSVSTCQLFSYSGLDCFNMPVIQLFWTRLFSMCHEVIVLLASDSCGIGLWGWTQDMWWRNCNNSGSCLPKVQGNVHFPKASRLYGLTPSKCGAFVWLHIKISRGAYICLGCIAYPALDAHLLP